MRHRQSRAGSRFPETAAGSGEEEDEAAPVDPFADLLFTLIAAVLPAILVLLPAMHLSMDAPGRLAPSLPDTPPARAEVRVEGQRAWPIVAQADGLRLTGLDNRVIRPNAIPDDATLRGVLERLRDGGEPLLLIVEPDGLESSFLLDPVVAAHGPPRMDQIRADRGCAAAAGGAFWQACNAGAAMPPAGRR